MLCFILAHIQGYTAEKNGEKLKLISICPADVVTVFSACRWADRTEEAQPCVTSCLRRRRAAGRRNVLGIKALCRGRLRASISLALFFFILYFQTGFLCSPGCPEAHCVDQAGLRARKLLPLLPKFKGVGRHSWPPFFFIS